MFIDPASRVPGPSGGRGETTGVAIETTYGPLLFVLALCEPRIGIDGMPPRPFPWGRRFFSCLPGEHDVEVYVPYLFFPKFGQAKQRVSVGPGQTVHVTYRPGMTAFSRGTLAFHPEGFGPASSESGVTRMLKIIAFIGVLAVLFGFSVPWIRKWMASKAPEEETVIQDARALYVELPTSASKPLATVLDDLDCSRDQEALETFGNVVKSRMRAHRFEELDAYGAALLQTKARFPGGGWKIYTLVGALDAPAGRRDGTFSRAVWEAHLEHLRTWVARSPESPVATVGLGAAWVTYAWEARGSGYANTVSQADWALFHERLDQARTALESAPPSAKKNPMWYNAMQQIALGQGWKREVYDQLFGEATALEPDFLHAYFAKAYYLLPRWHGEAGEWERYAKEVANQRGGEEGDATYFWIMRSMKNVLRGDEMRRDPLIDWARVKRGFAALDGRFGMDLWTLNMHCNLLAVSNDREASLPILVRIGERSEIQVWGSHEKYREFRDWALRRGKYVNAP